MKNLKLIIFLFIIFMVFVNSSFSEENKSTTKGSFTRETFVKLCRNFNKVTKYKIPDGYTSIERGVFQDCYNLKTVVIPKSVKTIGDIAFYGCTSLESVIIPDNVTSIKNGAFQGCYNLKSIIIPESVRKIYPNTFAGCSSLKSVKIPDSVTSIEEGAFRYCTELTSIEIPDSVRTIGDNAFRDCKKLQKVKIPTNVASIGAWAFESCYSLTEITIQKNVKSIGKAAFGKCIELQKIEVDSENDFFCDIDGVLFNKDKSILICYPAGKNETIYRIPNTVIEIAVNAFGYCEKLTEIQIPNSVKTICTFAFEWTTLNSITIPASVTKIEKFAFHGFHVKEIIFEDKQNWKYYRDLDDKESATANVTDNTRLNEMNLCGENSRTQNWHYGMFKE